MSTVCLLLFPKFVYRIDPRLTCNSVVFSRKEFKNTKMTAVDTDVFWCLEVSLCDINYAAVSVPTVNKIVHDCILVAFTNQFIRDDNLLVVHRKLFKGDYFIFRLQSLIRSLVIHGAVSVMSLTL